MALKYNWTTPEGIVCNYWRIDEVISYNPKTGYASLRLGLYLDEEHKTNLPVKSYVVNIKDLTLSSLDNNNPVAIAYGLLKQENELFIQIGLSIDLTKAENC